MALAHPRKLRWAACVLLAGCATSGGTYAISDQAAHGTGCQPQMSVGERFQFTVRIRNSGTHSWKGTYVFLRDDGFVRNQFSDDRGDQAQDVGAGQLRFPGLAAGASGSYSATFTASQPGNRTVEMQWWGSGTASGTSDLPPSTVDLSCAVAVNP